MRIFAITFGDQHAPSTHYRVLQYVHLLAAEGHALQWVDKKKFRWHHLDQVRNADVVLVQKALLPVPLLWVIRHLARRLVYDTDDAVWTRPGRPYGFFTAARVRSRLHAVLRAADAVSCANEFLAGYARRYSRNVQVVPMSLPVPPMPAALPGQMVVGWTGSPGNLPFLKLCEAPLKTFLERHRDAKLKIFCGQKPQLDVPFEYTPWSPDAEAAFLGSLSVGLLPLPPGDDFAKGKSPIKALLYGARGVPVLGNLGEGGAAEIASRGGCVSVQTTEEWLLGLERLASAPEREALGRQAWENVRKNHDQRKVFERFRDALAG